MGQILVRESFLVESMSMPNFMKIERGWDFFVELAWNDLLGMTIIQLTACN